MVYPEGRLFFVTQQERAMQWTAAEWGSFLTAAGAALVLRSVASNTWTRKHGPACSRYDRSLPVVSLARARWAGSQTDPAVPLLAVAWVWAVRPGV